MRIVLASLLVIAAALSVPSVRAQSIDLCRNETDFGTAANQNPQVYILFNGASVPSNAGVPVSPLPNPYVQLVSGGIYQVGSSVNTTNLNYNFGWNEYANTSPVYPPTGALFLNIVAPYHDSDSSRTFVFSVYDPVYQTSDGFSLFFTQITHDFSTNNCPVVIQKGPSTLPNNTQSFTLVNSNSFSAMYQTDRYYINMINMPQAQTVLNVSQYTPPNGIVVVISPITAYTQANAVNSADVFRDAVIEAALLRHGLDPQTHIRDRAVAGPRVFYKFAGTEDLLVIDDDVRTISWVGKGGDGQRVVLDSLRY